MSSEWDLQKAVLLVHSILHSLRTRTVSESALPPINWEDVSFDINMASGDRSLNANQCLCHYLALQKVGAMHWSEVPAIASTIDTSTPIDEGSLMHNQIILRSLRQREIEHFIQVSESRLESDEIEIQRLEKQVVEQEEEAKRAQEQKSQAAREAAIQKAATKQPKTPRSRPNTPSSTPTPSPQPPKKVPKVPIPVEPKFKRDPALEQLLLNILDKVYARDDSIPFHEAVDTKQVPDYLDVIKRPMDIATLRKRVKSGQVQLKQFVDLLFLIFDNAMLYNEEGSDYYNMGLRLKALAAALLQLTFPNFDLADAIGQRAARKIRNSAAYTKAKQSLGGKSSSVVAAAAAKASDKRKRKRR